MLVLSRKVGESVIIGDTIVVTVTEIDNGRVRIGVQAPREVTVLRSELIGREEWWRNNREIPVPGLPEDLAVERRS